MEMNGIEQLCPNCGLCCDSTLFADVELRAGDDAKQLKKLGLTLEKKGRGSWRSCSRVRVSTGNCAAFITTVRSVAARLNAAC